MVKPGLSGLVTAEHKLELCQNYVPISTLGCPVLNSFLLAGYNILRRESSLAKLGLFLVICRNRWFNSSMILVMHMIFRISMGYEKKCSKYLNCLPDFCMGGVLFPPLSFEHHEVFQRLILNNGGIDLLQIVHQLFDVFIVHKRRNGRKNTGVVCLWDESEGYFGTNQGLVRCRHLTGADEQDP